MKPLPAIDPQAIQSAPPAAQPLLLKKPAQPTWIFAAQERASPELNLKKFRIEAESEKEARRKLVATHICFFMGRIKPD